MNDCLDQLGVCRRCTIRTSHLDAHRAFAVYTGIARALVLRAKNQYCAVTTRLLGSWISIALRHLHRPDVLVPIPSHWTRTFFRGHNPVLLIAREVSQMTGVRTVSLLGCRWTETQQGKTDAQREANVYNKFYARHDMKGLRVMLIDDVMTTGATLDEAARICKLEGAHSVVGTTALQAQTKGSGYE
jgi:ComF family protein